MSESHVTLTVDERAYLVRLLEVTLKDSRVEEHRTRAPSYCEHIIQQEELITGLLSKLGKPPK